MPKEKDKPKRRSVETGWVCLAECTVCGNWPNELHDDLSTNYSATADRFPEAVKKLILIRGDRSYEKPEIRRCPECGTYYHINNVYEWTTTGNYDDDYLKRLTPKEALDMVPDAEKAELESSWDSILQCLRRCKSSLKPHLAEFAKRALRKN